MYMCTLLVRDEQGNMRIVHDWWRKDDDISFVELVSRIRKAYPNASFGLEFGYYYTGDDRSPQQDTKVTEAFERLPNFRSIHLQDLVQESDWKEQRTLLKRTAPRMRIKGSMIKREKREAEGKKNAPTFRCSCGWSGNKLSDLADYDGDSIYCFDWKCPECKRSHAVPTQWNTPINVEILCDCGWTAKDHLQYKESNPDVGNYFCDPCPKCLSIPNLP